MLDGRRLHGNVRQGGVAGAKGHQAGNTGLEAELDRKASAELASKGTLALQDAMELQVRLELDRLKECLAKIR